MPGGVSRAGLRRPGRWSRYAMSGRRGGNVHRERPAQPTEAFMKIDGACHCGYITIEGEADPEKTQICHCTDCQTGTGSAFRVSVPVSGASFKMLGQPTGYIK